MMAEQQKGKKEKKEKIPRQPMPQRPLEERRTTFKEVPLGYSPEQAILEASRCIMCTKPKCVEGCPVEIDIPGFIQLIKEGKFIDELVKVSEAKITQLMLDHEKQMSKFLEQLKRAGRSSKIKTGIGRAFNVALASLPNFKYPNDISASERYFKEDLIEPPYSLNSDGTITVPNKPGMNINLEPCVFFDDKGQCEIYDDRISICKAYGTQDMKCRYQNVGMWKEKDIANCSIQDIRDLDGLAIDKDFPILGKMVKFDKS